jgi:hypothetical protein
MKINDDGTATARFGDATTTFDLQPGPDGRTQVRAAVQHGRTSGSHGYTITDGGQKTTLTCGFDEFTAIVEGGTAESREDYAVSAHDRHVDKVNARPSTPAQHLFNDLVNFVHKASTDGDDQ